MPTMARSKVCRVRRQSPAYTVHIARNSIALVPHARYENVLERRARFAHYFGAGLRGLRANAVGLAVAQHAPRGARAVAMKRTFEFGRLWLGLREFQMKMAMAIEDFRQRVAEQELAAVDDRHIIRDTLDFVEQMRREENRPAFGGDAAHHRA